MNQIESYWIESSVCELESNQIWSQNQNQIKQNKTKPYWFESRAYELESNRIWKCIQMNQNQTMDEYLLACFMKYESYTFKTLWLGLF